METILLLLAIVILPIVVLVVGYTLAVLLGGFAMIVLLPWHGLVSLIRGDHDGFSGGESFAAGFVLSAVLGLILLVALT